VVGLDFVLDLIARYPAVMATRTATTTAARRFVDVEAGA